MLQATSTQKCVGEEDNERIVEGMQRFSGSGGEGVAAPALASVSERLVDLHPCLLPSGRWAVVEQRMNYSCGPHAVEVCGTTRRMVFVRLLSPCQELSVRDTAVVRWGLVHLSARMCVWL